jgi:prepilin-type N-terminal cleavage/methylation domain-containing protein
MSNARRQFAFTLLELILVMVIITTALAMAAPSLGGWGRASKLRDMGDQFLGVTHWARSQAIADAQIYRLNIDPTAGAYWVTMQSGTQFVELGNSFGQVYALPEGYRIAMSAVTPAETADPAAPDAPTAKTIDFMPDGRLTPARIQIMSDLGSSLEIAALAPAEQFALVEPTEAKR